MGDFSWKRDFKYISWKATLVTALYRSFATGIAFSILMLAFPSRGMEPWLPWAAPLIVPVGYFAIFLPLGLITGSLSRMGVPYIGLVSIVCSFFIVPGDPLLFIFHQVTGKKYVPVRDLSILNFSIILFVIDEEKRAAAGGVVAPQPAATGDSEVKAEKKTDEACPFTGRIVLTVKDGGGALGFKWDSKETKLEIHRNWKVTSNGSDFGVVNDDGTIVATTMFSEDRSDHKNRFMDKPVLRIDKLAGRAYDSSGREVAEFWPE